MQIHGRPSLRNKILESGLRTVHEHGFGNTGIRDITAAGGVTEPFARTIEAAQAAGEVRADFAAGEIASVLMSSWQGAMLWMKVQRSAAPIERFKRVTLASLTAPHPAAQERSSGQP